MISGSLRTHSPFPEPGLLWRELRFRPEDRQEMATEEEPPGRVSVTLPADLAGAVAKRRSEFLAGRLCAALALRAAGLPQEVGRKGRAPVWPAGIVGAISHSDSRAIAVISRHHSGLGVDCEEIMPLTRAEALHTEILTAEELTLRPSTLPFATFVTLVFSAKETLYKALSPRLAHIPGFLEVRLTGIREDRLALDFAGESLEARFRLTAEDCVTLMALR